GVQAHAPRAGLPHGAGAVAAQPRQLLPGAPAVLRAEEAGVLDARVDRVRIGERRLEMPDTLELPRALRPVVPLMRGQRLAGVGRGIVNELVALAFGHALRRFFHAAAWRLPGFAAVAGALDDLPEPAARLRREDAVRIDRRSFEVIDLPA